MAARGLSFRPPRSYAGSMKTVHLSESELGLVRNAMNAYLNSFGHDEADVVMRIKQVLVRLAAATDDQPEQSELIG